MTGRAGALPSVLARSLAPAVRAAALLLACAAAGCGRRDAAGRTDDWRVVFRVEPNSAMDFTASPGALFLAGGGGLFRRLPEGCGAAPGTDAVSERGCWQRVADTPEPIVRIWAPTRDEAFALPRPNLVYHWRAPGTSMDTMRTPLTDSVLVDGHYRRAVFVLDLGGTSPRDVYAVGEDGAIVRYDGRAWTLEPNPLVPVPGRRNSPTLRTLYGAALLDGHLYAAGIAGDEYVVVRGSPSLR